MGLYQTQCRNCHLCCLWGVGNLWSLRKGDTSWGSLGWMWNSLRQKVSLPWASDSLGNIHHRTLWARRHLHLLGRRKKRLRTGCQVFNRGAQRSRAGTLKDQWVQTANFMPKDLAGSELSSLKSSLDHVTFSFPLSWQPRKNTDNRGSHTHIETQILTYTHTQTRCRSTT